MKKIFTCTILAAVLFFGANSLSYAIECNSPCLNPCVPSRTVCEGANCTTYCGSSSVYGGTYYVSPGVSFSYSTPNVSFSITNEVYGLHNLFHRPIKVINGFRPVYHRYPAKPVIKPYHPEAKRPHSKPRPAVNKSHSKPAPKRV